MRLLQDLLWRRRVASEVELLKEQEAHQAANNRHWSHRETDMLVEAYKRHGVANFESIKRDPKYTQLVTARGRAGLHNKWKELTAGGLDLQDILEARERQSTQVARLAQATPRHVRGRVCSDTP